MGYAKKSGESVVDDMPDVRVFRRDVDVGERALLECLVKSG
jgi:hypothetical protein